MSHYMETYRKYKYLELTVLEYFAEADFVHEHCKLQVDLIGLNHPRLLAKHLLANSEVLRNRTHRLYYVVPAQRLVTVIQLDDYIACEVFFEWFRRHVNRVYAVVVNRTTRDYEKVVTFYVNQMVPLEDTDRDKHFKETVAKPFSHRPAEPEVDPPDDHFYNQQSLSHGDVNPVSVASVSLGRSSRKHNSRTNNKHNRPKR